MVRWIMYKNYFVPIYELKLGKIRTQKSETDWNKFLLFLQMKQNHAILSPIIKSLPGTNLNNTEYAIERIKRETRPSR